METWEKIAPQVVKPLQKNLDLYFSSPELTLNRTLNKSCHLPESENKIHVFVDASAVAVAAVAYLKTVPNLATDVETCYLKDKCKVAPIKQISIPKLELEAAVIGVRILSTIMKESSFHITRSTLWTNSQVVLDWLSTTKKQPVFVANRLKEILASTDAYQWKHITTKENPADHGTRGLNPDEIPAKWLSAPAFLSTRQLSAPENSPKHVLATHEISRNLSEQKIDPTRFSTWNKLLLTLATVFNLVFRIRKQRPKDQQYKTEEVILARNRLIKMSQQNFFSTIQALKRGSRIDSKRKSVRSTQCWTTTKCFGHAEDCNLRQITSKSRNFLLYCTQRQDSETLYRACTQHLRSPRNRASESFCAAKIPHHWPQDNTFEYKVPMFSLQTICRSKHSTCHGSPSCLPFSDRLYSVSFREERS